MLERDHVTFEQQPILVRWDFAHTISINLNPGNVFMGKPVLHTFNKNIDGAEDRFAIQWKNYNRWLNQWYFKNSPGPHLSARNELTTKFRAFGLSEDRVQAKVEHVLAICKWNFDSNPE